MSFETIYGINAVASRLKVSGRGVQRLLIRAGSLSARLQAILDLGEQIECTVERVSDKQLSTMTEVNHQGVGLIVASSTTLSEDNLFVMLEDNHDDVLLLVLDGVTDPRNLGACLRSAASLGVVAVIVPKNNSAPLNEAAMKTASGGAAAVPLVRVVNLARCLVKLREYGVWIVGTVLDTQLQICDVDLTGNIALVMGSEGKGLRQKTVKYCDFLANIPMASDSFGLNVSVATGICLYEVDRQRRNRTNIS